MGAHCVPNLQEQVWVHCNLAAFLSTHRDQRGGEIKIKWKMKKKIKLHFKKAQQVIKKKTLLLSPHAHSAGTVTELVVAWV